MVVSFQGGVFEGINFDIGASYLIPIVIIIHFFADLGGFVLACRGNFKHRKSTANFVYLMSTCSMIQKCISLWAVFDFNPVSTWCARITLSVLALITVIANLEALRNLLSKVHLEGSKFTGYFQYVLVALYLLLVTPTWVKVGSLGETSSGFLSHNGTIFAAFILMCIVVEEINQILMAKTIAGLGYTVGNVERKIIGFDKLLATICLTIIIDLAAFTWAVISLELSSNLNATSYILSQDLLVWHCNFLTLSFYWTENLQVVSKSSKSTGSTKQTSQRQESRV